MTSVTEASYANIAQASKSNVVSASTSAKSSFGAGSVDETFSTFLKLLTTQLKNQDPSAPTDPDKFADQLTKFTGLEQQLKSNQSLDAIIAQLASNSNFGALSFIDKQVTSSGKTTELANGNAVWNLTSPSGSVLSAKATIRNEAGQTVSEENFTLTPGSQSYSWNGKDKNNIAFKDGKYTLTIDAKDASGSQVAVDSSTRGIVTGVDLSGASPVILVGSRRLSMQDITSVVTPPATQTSAGLI